MPSVILFSLDLRKKRISRTLHHSQPTLYLWTMKKTIFYLATCSTCQRIMKELNVDDTWTLREIKSKGVLKKEVDMMKKLVGSYEELFNRRAMKYRQWGLNEKDLNEDDYRNLITEEYTFLKRPVIILDDQIFVGNGKKAVHAAKAFLNS